MNKWPVSTNQWLPTTFQLKEPRLRDVMWLAQGHTASELENEDLKSGWGQNNLGSLGCQILSQLLVSHWGGRGPLRPCFCMTHSLMSTLNSSEMFAENHSLWKHIWIPLQTSWMSETLMLHRERTQGWETWDVKALCWQTRPGPL